MHQIASIVYYQCMGIIPDGYVNHFESVFAYQLYYYENMGRAIEKMDLALADVEHVQFKGRMVAELYPVPELRSMGDVDFMIRGEDRERSDGLLIDAGFERGERGDNVWVYSNGRFMFEIHDNLLSQERSVKGRYEYFGHFWEHVDFSDGRLDWNFHMIILLMHLEKHLSYHGAGLRQFMDVAVVSKFADIDWEYIRGELEKISLLEFAKRVFALNERWFCVSAPSWAGAIDDEFAEDAVQEIFANGVFGFYNKNNMENGTLGLKMVKEGISYKAARRKHLCKSAFPGYESMRRLPYCSYVDEHKVLLPVAYVHRVFHRFSKKNFWKDYKSYSFAPKESVESRVEMLKRWGIE